MVSVHAHQADRTDLHSLEPVISSMKKTPYQKILRAADRGTGLRLTAEEVAKLAGDSAIETVAWNDDENESKRRGRDHKSNRTHCPLGHEYAGEHLQLDRKGYRHCKTCSRIKQRIKSGWPKELAMSLPAQKPGYSPLRRGSEP